MIVTQSGETGNGIIRKALSTITLFVMCIRVTFVSLNVSPDDTIITESGRFVKHLIAL